MAIKKILTYSFSILIFELKSYLHYSHTKILIFAIMFQPSVLLSVFVNLRKFQEISNWTLFIFCIWVNCSYANCLYLGIYFLFLVLLTYYSFCFFTESVCLEIQLTKQPFNLNNVLVATVLRSQNFLVDYIKVRHEYSNIEEICDHLTLSKNYNRIHWSGWRLLAMESTTTLFITKANL